MSGLTGICKREKQVLPLLLRDTSWVALLGVSESFRILKIPFKIYLLQCSSWDPDLIFLVVGVGWFSDVEGPPPPSHEVRLHKNFGGGYHGKDWTLI